MRQTVVSTSRFFETEEGSKFYYKIHKNNEITISKKTFFKKIYRFFGLTFGYHSFETTAKKIKEVSSSSLPEPLESIENFKVELRNSKVKKISSPSTHILIKEKKEMLTVLDEKKEEIEEIMQPLYQLHLDKLKQKRKSQFDKNLILDEVNRNECDEFNHFFVSEYYAILELLKQLPELNSENFEIEFKKISRRVDEFTKKTETKKEALINEIVDLMEPIEPEQVLSLLR